MFDQTQTKFSIRDLKSKMIKLNKLKIGECTTKDAAFWEFSFDEMGLYDIPASVNYIKEKTSF